MYLPRLPGPTRRGRRGGQNRARSESTRRDTTRRDVFLSRRGVSRRGDETTRRFSPDKEAPDEKVQWQAREIHWLTTIEKGNRVVVVYSRGFGCRAKVHLALSLSFFGAKM
jgi:hypothetical protein